MLKSVEFTNYRCLRDVRLRLGPLTVLVGPNASGKSAVLEALHSDSRLQESDRWHHDRSVDVQVQFRFSEGKRNVLLRAGAPHQVVEASPNRGIRFQTQLLQLDLAKLRAPNLGVKEEILRPDGSNLANVFDTLGRRVQEDLVLQYCELVPMFSDLDAKATSNGYQQIVFRDRWATDVQYTPDQVSDGSILVLAYMLLQYQNPQVDLVAIEEPERGLHPYLLGELVSLMRHIAKGEIGPKPVQIVLATHSAELLDHIEPDEARFMTRRGEDGAVVVDDWRNAFSEYDRSLGGMWLSGGLGGVPGR